ncbi:hypothetical protein ACIBSW_18480 [Actinoplanes sp. NPDC049668]|uniref:hypothetical protein n=1 Tax=unclassified Actinoplanes TaxID=2626549 RepID=UPI0033B5FE76
MDEITVLREAFDPDATPSPAARERARSALLSRMDAPVRATRSRHWRLRVPIAISVATATAVVAAVAVTDHGGTAPAGPAARQESTQAGSPQVDRPAAVPYLRPVSAAQYLENAAWSAERQTWADPDPKQFMYVETSELRNPRGYENRYPNGSLVPGKAKYRKVQVWTRVDGQIQGTMRKGGIEVFEQNKDGVVFSHLDWSHVVALTTPDKVRTFAEHPKGPIWVEPSALIGQYVVPPAVQAAIFRYLAQEPGMKVNLDAVNIDGRPAIGMGRILEGYLSQELLFDKETYRLIGERLIAVRDEVKDFDDGTAVTRKGDVLRQVIYNKMIIVDALGDTE